MEGDAILCHSRLMSDVVTVLLDMFDLLKSVIISVMTSPIKSKHYKTVLNELWYASHSVKQHQRWLTFSPTCVQYNETQVLL